VVLALDEDEAALRDAKSLISSLEARPRIEKVLNLINAPRVRVAEPFKICHAWQQMSNAAWNAGVDWVVFLGDDVRIYCDFH
jgi:hypothetical protein